MISYEYKTIMVHIDKCAGTSICNHFKAYKSRHEKWNIYQKNHTDEWENYFTFAFVRNPWDRVLSAYLFHLFLTEADVYNNHRNIKKQQAPKTIIKTLARQENFKTHYKDFNYFLRFNRGLKRIFHSNRNTKFNPCYKYIYDEDMNCQVDFVGRYETLNQDMTYIQQKLGMPIEPIPHHNSTKSKRPHYSAFYNEENIEIIRELYKVDIELFDYKFERVVPYDHNLANTLDWI